MFYLSREAKEGVEIALVRGVMGLLLDPLASRGTLTQRLCFTPLRRKGRENSDGKAEASVLVPS
jgi:hypothetical protein